MLLGTEAFRSALSNDLRAAVNNVLLVSAYITNLGIDWLINRLESKHISCDIVSRWSLQDLISGASSLETYEKISSRGWCFYIYHDLHAKVYLVDDTSLFIGSANLTGPGLSLALSGNKEIGVRLSPTPDDLRSIRGLLGEAVLITPEIYKEIKEVVESEKQNTTPVKYSLNWPEALQRKLLKEVNRLWVADLLWTSSPRVQEDKGDEGDVNDNRFKHDISLLGMDQYSDSSIPSGEIRHFFRLSKAWEWLHAQLNNSIDKELYFGALTKKLHDALLDDPKPYRTDVKTLVNNLIGWIQYIELPEVSIDKPNHSTRLKLLK